MYTIQVNTNVRRRIPGIVPGIKNLVYLGIADVHIISCDRSNAMGLRPHSAKPVDALSDEARRLRNYTI